MVRQPEVFLMDEPLSNLDAKLRTSMRAEVSKLYREVGGTFVALFGSETPSLSVSHSMMPSCSLRKLTSNCAPEVDRQQIVCVWSGRFSEGKLHFHRPRSIRGKLKGFHGAFKRQRIG
jgi:hypothetical protein